jgi:hypothetical protein
VLRGLPTNEATIRKAIDEITRYDNHRYLESVGSLQDPFVVLQCIQSALIEARKDSRPEPLMPIWGCDCGIEGSLIVSGSLEYKAMAPHTYEMVKPVCRKCNRSDKIEEAYLPREFFVRVANCVQDIGAINVVKEPHFRNYFLTGTIQYNPKLNHFRYFRTEYGKASVIECGVQSKSRSDRTKEELLNESGWFNYLHAYTIGKGKVAAEYQGPIPKLLTPDQYNKGIYGGSDARAPPPAAALSDVA